MENTIAQVGLGRIAATHRKGYRQQGLTIIAGIDPSPEARTRFQQDVPDAAVFASLEELLRSPLRPTVLDVATPHHRAARLPIVEAAAQAGLPLLLQKPVGLCYADALETANILADSQTPAMVNQNMAFTPGAQWLYNELLTKKTIGAPFFAQMELRTDFACDPANWFGKDPRWWTVDHTVHHLSVLHMIFGPPASVDALTGRDPSQTGVSHDGFGHLLMRYASGVQVMVLSTGCYYGTRPVGYRDKCLYIQGTQGIIDWAPEGEVAISRRGPEWSAPSQQKTITVEGRWFYDAFGQTMQHLLAALAAGQPPKSAIEDNLYVMAVIEAAYRSAADRRPVTLPEIMGERFDPEYGPGFFHGFQPPPITPQS
ncbi:MAG: Gfo/Idh/MocA family oxidoreductase [Candidatus Marinimicrobia bacterium]|nr:Gfo/Idh/MocA family oxidoreductase [Candidatus Neomarinimicrobiota bacterium]